MTDQVDALLSVRPNLEPRTRAGQQFANTMKTWFLSDNDFDEEAWQKWVGEVVTVEHEAGMNDRWMGICAVGGCANAATRDLLVPHRIDSLDLALEIVVCDDHEIDEVELDSLGEISGGRIAPARPSAPGLG